jgi:hypothetical protein
MAFKGRRFNNITVIESKLWGTFSEFQRDSLHCGLIAGPTVQSPKETTLKGTTSITR